MEQQYFYHNNFVRGKKLLNPLINKFPPITLSKPTTNRKKYRRNHEEGLALGIWKKLVAHFPKTSYKVVGTGSYGLAILLKGDIVGFVLKFVSSKGTNVLMGAKVPKRCLLKIQVLKDFDSEKSSIKEDGFLKTIYEKVVTLSPFLTIYGKDIVPQFYQSGSIVFPEEHVKLRLTLQEYVRGKTVSDLDFKISTKTFVLLETKIFFLWLLGFSHTDLHEGNIIIKGDNPYLIDLGFTVQMPQQLVTNLREVFLHIFSGTFHPRDLDKMVKAYDAIYNLYASSILYKRLGYNNDRKEKIWLWSDSLILKHLRKLHPDNDVIAERTKLWTGLIKQGSTNMLNKNNAVTEKLANLSIKVPRQKLRSPLKASLRK